MSTDNLFTPLELGPLQLPNRIFMAPLTRCRAPVGHVPTPLMAEYYAQRATAGLIIAEATMVMAGNSAFLGAEPGIYNHDQITGWKLVTDAVHAAGGHIFLQLWHGGRACHSYFNDGRIPVAPSPLTISNSEVHTPMGKQSYDIPRELGDDEIPGIIEGFRKAAENAKTAGFDGVEVHGANGYLLDEFLRDGANIRKGPYGGSVENRAKLLLEVFEAVATVWGTNRTGVRISPLNSFNSMIDSDPVGLTTYVAKSLSDLGAAYLHVMRADFMGKQKGDVVTPAREHFKGTLIVNMGYSPVEAEEVIGSGLANAVAFGTSFLANPDLPARIKAGASLNAPNPKTFYTSGKEGYTDYPTLG